MKQASGGVTALSRAEGGDRRRDALRRHLSQPEERARLVRFCRRLSGDGEVAEDLAQEALLEAWRQADGLNNPQVWRSWLHGIARNMYLRWHRGRAREHSRIAPDPDGGAPSLLDLRADDGPDLQTVLERQELAHLLGRAMGALPAPTRQMLVQHYVEEMPQGEIAARLGLNENTAAVRLHRGKQTLRRVLTTDLRDEAAAFGILPHSEGGWQETRLWCPFCGKRHLQAGPGRLGERDFKLTCRGCHFVMGPRVIDFPSDCIFAHHALDPSRVLEGVQGYKPALNRLSRFYHEYLTRGAERGEVLCLGCGAALPVSSARPAHLKPHPHAGFHTNCPRCRKIHVLLPSAFAFCAPPVQQFWKLHPRMRFLPSRPVPGSGAFVLTAESVTDCARLDVVFSGEDYRILETRSRAG